uniref:Uncharacterized protein n=1 Tax=Physcomitrium patens TaxID=3218 RepID=A0A2K1IR81_PHYPA|nr:hypothetical protein PHYPA_025909 [Physcomitrium patens]
MCRQTPLVDHCCYSIHYHRFTSICLTASHEAKFERCRIMSFGCFRRQIILGLWHFYSSTDQNPENGGSY